MTLPYDTYIVLLIFSQTIIIFLGIYIIRYHSFSIFKETILLFVLLFIMAFGNMLEVVNGELDTKIFWANIEYVSYSFLPFAWFITIVKLYDTKNWLNFKRLITLALFPTLAFSGVLTNRYHRLFRVTCTLIHKDSFLLIDNTYGPWFWFLVIQSYLFISASVVILMKNIFKGEERDRVQSILFLLGIIVLWVPNILNNLNIFPQDFDISPAFIGLPGFIVFLALNHYHIFDLIPVTREMVVEEMGMGIIVLDKKLRVFDINSRARDLLDLDNEFKPGKYLAENIKDIFDINVNNTDELLQKGNHKMKIMVNGEERYYELHLFPLDNQIKGLGVWVIIINNITNLELAREQIFLHRKELAVMKEERGWPEISMIIWVK